LNRKEPPITRISIPTDTNACVRIPVKAEKPSRELSGGVKRISFIPVKKKLAIDPAEK